MNSSNTNWEKNEMIYMRSKIRVLHKAYKQVFEQLYIISMPRLVKQEWILTKRPIQDNKQEAMS
jgi:hypothetical protein